MTDASVDIRERITGMTGKSVLMMIASVMSL